MSAHFQTSSIGFGILCLIHVIITIDYWLKHVKRAKKTGRTEARVLEVEEFTRGGVLGYHPVIAEIIVAGKKHVLELRKGYRLEQCNVGDILEIQYDELNPNKHSIVGDNYYLENVTSFVYLQDCIYFMQYGIFICR